MEKKIGYFQIMQKYIYIYSSIPSILDECIIETGYSRYVGLKDEGSLSVQCCFNEGSRMAHGDSSSS